jgi:predicted Ser/Thr protein kinase
MKETSQGAQIKDKDLSNVKVLIGVKDKIEDVKKKNDEVQLNLDQLEESLRLLSTVGNAKDKQIKENKKLFDEWVSVKKLAKDMDKEIKPLVQ